MTSCRVRNVLRWQKSACTSTAAKNAETGKNDACEAPAVNAGRGVENRLSHGIPVFLRERVTKNLILNLYIRFIKGMCCMYNKDKCSVMQTM